jgi:hypothetical protein
MPGTVHVTEQLIGGLMGNKGAQDLFPFLRHAAARLETRRGGCCGGRTARRSTDLQMIKLTMFGMATAELQKLKQFLNADKLVFTLIDRGGKCTQHER